MSVLPPRPLLAACLVLLGGLAWTVEGRPPPTIAPAEAPLWEGQAVVVEGWAQDVGQTSGGALRFAIVEGRHAVAARMTGPGEAGAGGAGGAGAGPPMQTGDRVAVPGRLARGTGGDLQLLVDDPGGVRRIAARAAAVGDWASIAASPAEWTGLPLRLAGLVDDDAWGSAGHVLRLGEGPWPKGGAVEAEGFLRYDAACLCYAFDAVRVWPWTP